MRYTTSGKDDPRSLWEPMALMINDSTANGVSIDPVEQLNEDGVQFTQE